MLLKHWIFMEYYSLSCLLMWNFGWRRYPLLFFISNGDRYHGHQKEFAFNVHWSLKAKHDLSCFKAMEEYTLWTHMVMNFKKAFRIK